MQLSRIYSHVHYPFPNLIPLEFSTPVDRENTHNRHPSMSSAPVLTQSHHPRPQKRPQARHAPELPQSRPCETAHASPRDTPTAHTFAAAGQLSPTVSQVNLNFHEKKRKEKGGGSIRVNAISVMAKFCPTQILGPPLNGT